MTAQDLMTERAKYVCLLQLSREQTKAIDSGDSATFDRLLRAKEALINSLNNAPEVIAADQSLVAVIDAITASEAEAQVLLQQKIDEVGAELRTVKKRSGARNAYARFDGFSKHGFDLRSDKTIPRFIDSSY